MEGSRAIHSDLEIFFSAAIIALKKESIEYNVKVAPINIDTIAIDGQNMISAANAPMVHLETVCRGEVLVIVWL